MKRGDSEEASGRFLDGEALAARLDRVHRLDRDELETLAEDAAADGQRRGVIVLGPVENVLDDPEPTARCHRAQGSSSFNFIDTGTYHVDFVDPALADQNSEWAEAVHVTLTRGGTFVVSVAFHDFPTGIRIWERFHLTEVDGSPVVEREIQKVTGCP